MGTGMNGAGGYTLFTDQRGYTPFAGVWDIGAYQYNGVPPTTTLSASTVTPLEYGRTSYSFSIIFASNAAIEQPTLAGATVQVVPPSSLGGPITAAVVGTVASGPTDPLGDAQSFTVTYQITPPGGSWSLADDGTDSVNLGGSRSLASMGTRSLPEQSGRSRFRASPARRLATPRPAARLMASRSYSRQPSAAPWREAARRPDLSCSMTQRRCWAPRRSAPGRPP
jgi:hypothetical protein